MAEHERETTVIATDGGGGGGTILAVVLLIAVLALLFYLFGDRIMGESKETKIDVDVSAPAKTG
jgi:hypothetical protein